MTVTAVADCSRGNAGDASPACASLGGPASVGARCRRGARDGPRFQGGTLHGDAWQLHRLWPSRWREGQMRAASPMQGRRLHRRQTHDASPNIGSGGVAADDVWSEAGQQAVSRRRHRRPRSARALLTLLVPLQTSPARPSTRTQSRRHYGGPLADAPRAGDGRLVPAGLLARGSMRIAPAFPPIARQWHSGATLAAYSCGGSRGFEIDEPRTAFPFHRRGPTGTATRPSRGPDRSNAQGPCQLLTWTEDALRLRTGGTATLLALVYFTASLTIPSSSASTAARAFCDAAAPVGWGGR